MKQIYCNSSDQGVRTFHTTYKELKLIGHYRIDESCSDPFHTTYKELKLEFDVGSAVPVGSFHTTYKELKLRIFGIVCLIVWTFHTTYKELKRAIRKLPNIIIDSFHTTYKELKHIAGVYKPSTIKFLKFDFINTIFSKS